MLGWAWDVEFVAVVEPECEAQSLLASLLHFFEPVPRCVAGGGAFPAGFHQVVLVGQTGQ